MAMKLCCSYPTAGSRNTRDDDFQETFGVLGLSTFFFHGQKGNANAHDGENLTLSGSLKTRGIYC